MALKTITKEDIYKRLKQELDDVVYRVLGDDPNTDIIYSFVMTKDLHLEKDVYDSQVKLSFFETVNPDLPSPPPPEEQKKGIRTTKRVG